MPNSIANIVNGLTLKVSNRWCKVDLNGAEVAVAVRPNPRQVHQGGLLSNWLIKRLGLL